MDFWWILNAKLRAKLTKKSILIGNKEKSYFLILASAKTLKLRFSGGQLRIKINEKVIQKSFKIWSAS